MRFHTAILIFLALLTAACTISNAAPSIEQNVDPASESADEMCRASLTLPAEDVVLSHTPSCVRQPMMIKSQADHIEYPCGGGPATLQSETDIDISRYLDSIHVLQNNDSLIIEAHSSPYLMYGCFTNVVERLETNLETGASTYTYEDEWGEAEYCLRTCPTVEVEGEFLKM